MDYTIQAQKALSTGFFNLISVVDQFTVKSINAFWGELGISDKDWEEWDSQTKSARQAIPIVAGFPQISRLAYILEGSVHFKPKELQDECRRLLPQVASADSTKILNGLLHAADLAANDANTDVVVHPYGVFKDTETGN